MSVMYLEQEELEKETRGQTVSRFHKAHNKATDNSSFSETFIGNYLLTNYLNPLADSLEKWIALADTGTAGRRHAALKHVKMLDAHTNAYIALKSIINCVGFYNTNKPVTYTSVALRIAKAIQTEIQLRAFEEDNPHLSAALHKDFKKRELKRDKKENYIHKEFEKQGREWKLWTGNEMVHIGGLFIDLFYQTTGDIEVKNISNRGKKTTRVILPTEKMMDVVAGLDGRFSSLLTLYVPTVIPPVDWSKDNLTQGGYYTHNITRYPLVKRGNKAYKRLLQEKADAGELERVFDSVNAIQSTPWAINENVLDAMQYVYDNSIHCGKLPRSEKVELEEAPASLADKTKADMQELPKDHPLRKQWAEFQQNRARTHEENRRVIGKRVMAQRAFKLAEKYSKYERFYFPHDMDSRGRLYPKPAGLNPQGPDYVKGLLQFADGKPLTDRGLYWLAVHGANCYGYDKESIDERAAWASYAANTPLIILCAENPRENLEWTNADNPAQFLAFCFEWAAAHKLPNPADYVSHLHIDLDATCSGLQHFSAMLRDEVGGRHVNMRDVKDRQDVYQAVASKTEALMTQDFGGDESSLAHAALKFGIGRSITKRAVMVKPYAGTLTSCYNYVTEAIHDRIEAGEPMPWPKENFSEFKRYVTNKVWEAIPHVVVAADGAMTWLTQMSRLVAKSNPESKRIEWTTPIGLPVWQTKFKQNTNRVDTFFDGSKIKVSLRSDAQDLDSRSMGSSVAPSFVHSLDASHLMATISAAWNTGIESFAVVHDSFGVHACNVDDFSYIIRQEFVLMYGLHDVLEEFYQSVEPSIKDSLKKKIPDKPPKGDLDLKEVLDNEFFFS